MAREVSSPQLKLLPHPTCSSDRPHPPCSSSTTHLLHATTAAPRDGTGPGRGTPGPCPLFSLPSLLQRRSLPLAPLPLSLCRPHSLARTPQWLSPGTVPAKQWGGRAGERGGLGSPAARRTLPVGGKAFGWPGAVSKTPAAAAGRSPPPAACTAAEAGPQASPLTAAPALRPPRPAPGVLELVPPRPWAG